MSSPLDPVGPRHIVVDARCIGWSTGRYVERLLTHLEPLDPVDRYTVLVHRHDLDRWQPSSANFRVELTDAPAYSFAEQSTLARHLRRLRPDLVHFCMPQQPVAHRGPTITTVHDLTLLSTYNAEQGWLRFHGRQAVFRGVLERVVRRSSVLLAPSVYTRDDIARRWPSARSRIVVTPEGAGLPMVEPREYPVPYRRYLLYVGQQKNYKNLVRLAEAHQRLLGRRPELGLVCVGRIGDAERRNLDHFAERGYRNIHMTGFVKDDQLAWLYRHCAAYVFPSLMEGFGLPGLEAMTHGAPVVSSDRTSLPEVYGNAARYVDPEDVDAIAAGLSAVVDDPAFADELRRRGQERAALFSWTRTAQQTLTAYRSVLGEPYRSVRGEPAVVDEPRLAG